MSVNSGEEIEVLNHLKVDELIRECCGGDQKDFFDSILVIFFENTSSNIEKISKGVTSRSLQDVADAAHSLKGTSLTLGAVRLGSAAEAVEKALSDEDFPRLDLLIKQILSDFELTKDEFGKYLDGR